MPAAVHKSDSKVTWYASIAARGRSKTQVLQPVKTPKYVLIQNKPALCNRNRLINVHHLFLQPRLTLRKRFECSFQNRERSTISTSSKSKPRSLVYTSR